MSQKKRQQESSCKRLKITLKVKREIIDKRERGVSVADLARMYNRSTSTICTILKNKNKIKEVDASKGVTRISTQRLRILDDVERLLLIWINEKQLHGDTINKSIICEKAKLIFADLVKTTPGSSTTGDEVFKASHGWFEKFKRRTGIHSVMRHGEAARSDTKAAMHFKANCKKLRPESVVECDVAGFKSVTEDSVVNVIVSQAHILGLKVEKYDIDELMEEHSQELTTEELMQLHCVSQQEDVKESLSLDEDEVAAKQLSLGEIRDMLKAWESVASYIEKHHPNKEVAMRATNLFNNNAVSPFYQILNRRHKQMSLDNSLVKKN